MQVLHQRATSAEMMNPTSVNMDVQTVVFANLDYLCLRSQSPQTEPRLKKKAVS